MFGNWLNGTDKTDKARIHIGVSALRWSIWNCRNDIIFLKRTLLLAGYSHYGSLDPALVLLAPGGPAGVHGFWMQPPLNGCPGYFLPGYLAAY
jgi:hypothetical protein